MMMFNRGLEDPAAMLWTVMLMVQSLPYAATVAVAWISARSYGRRPSAVVPAPAETIISKAA
jgi:hypothetical protein